MILPIQRISQALIIVSMVVFQFSFFIPQAKAQTVNQFNSWWYYTGTYTIMPRLHILSMYSWDRHNFVKDWLQSELKIGLGFDLYKNLTLAGGYEWVVQFPYGAYPIPEKRTEQRIYEQVKLKTRLRKLSLEYGIMAEHRFVSSVIKHRARIQLGVKVPIWKSMEAHSVGLSFYEQLFLNADKQLVGQHYAQNRLYGGVDIGVIKSLAFGVGYLNQYIVLKGNRAENNHTLIVTIAHYLDLSKKKPE